MEEQTSVRLKLPLAGYGQPNGKTCWYACYAMMYAWKGWSVSTLNERIAGTKIPRDRGLRQEEYGPMATAVLMTGVSVGAVKSWDIRTVIYRLSTWGPLFCCTTKFDGHAMVLLGADAVLNQVEVANPYNIVDYEASRGGSWTDAACEYYKLADWHAIIQPVPFAIQAFR